MIKKKVKVSIVIPTYNGSKYISKAIDSCLGQTYKDIEIIIVDDASTDGTSQIVKACRDKRIKYFRQNVNSGLPKALNKGFSLSEGEYLTWVSDDNFYSEQAIETMVKVLQRMKRVDFVYSSFFRIDKDGNVLSVRKVGKPKKLYINNCVGPCFLYRRKVYQEIGDYDSNVTLVEDYDYWLRILERFKMKRINKYLAFYRLHPDSLSANYDVDEVDRMVSRVRGKYINQSMKDYLSARKQFYNRNYKEARKLLIKGLGSNVFNLDIWRMLFIIFLGSSKVNAIRKVKYGIFNKNKVK